MPLPKSEDDLRGKSPAQLRVIVADLDAELRDLHLDERGEPRDLSDNEAERFDELVKLRNHAAERLEQHDVMERVYRDHPGSVARVYGGETLHAGRGWATAAGADLDPRVAEYRRSAMETLDRYQRADVLSAAAADRADEVLRSGDPQGLTAAYLAAVGDSHYASAFGKMLADPVTGHLRFSQEEARAVQSAAMAVAAAEYRAGPLVTSGTGFPLPLTVDPSVLITGAGALNPIRDLATVTVIGTHDWVGVSADSISASYDQEGSEVSDDTPTLAGPKISTQSGRAFVPVSLEAMMDWPSVASEMTRLIADAKNTLDSSMFLSGVAASFQPIGVLAGDATYSLTTSQRQLTATTAVLAVADPWTFKAQIPARFLGRTTFVANPALFDTIYRFVGGNSTEPYQFSGGDRGGDFLGRPKAEWSSMVATTTSGSKVLIGGDWATAYRIIDRLGMSAEIVPHLIGTTSHRPVGQRGIFAWWRTGAAVTGQNALRYLEVK